MRLSLQKILSTELIGWLILAVFCMYFLYPLRSSLRFGTDLVGGAYLTLHVQTDKAVEAELISKMNAIAASLKKTNNVTPISKTIKDNAIHFVFESLQDVQEASRIIKSEHQMLKVTSSEGTKLVLTLPDAVIDRIKKDAVQRNIEVLRLRLDKFSVAEIPIAAKGEDIVIEMPDVSDPLQAKELIGRAAQLEFRLVYGSSANKDELLYEYEGDVSDDKEILPSAAENGRRNYYLVQKYADVTGRMLKDARPGLGGRTGIEPIVQFAFDANGADHFYELTSKNIGRQIAIVLDGEVISAPTVESAIRDSGQISGHFTSETAKTTALLLKSGSFVAPVTFEEERIIGPALGQETRTKGLVACLLGLALLLVFSIFFYKLSGLFAFIVLLYNLLLILLGLAWLKATLTLPGIAGMVLTIGMAIDASILIFEHIKEVLREGTSVNKAVQAGFADAMVVIVDANITTLIVGIVLYYFSTGPVQGFAVTMMLGIISTLITGLFFLRSIFRFMLNNFEIKKLSI